MGRDLQKRKRRSSRQPIKQSNNKPKKLLNPLGNSTIARNWNKKETMTQNYRRLGLVARLKAAKGGVEKFSSVSKSSADPFVIASTEKSVVKEVAVERDADGKIISIGGKRDNPLNDPLNELDTDSEREDEKEYDDHWEGISDERKDVITEANRPQVLRELEAEAARPAKVYVRQQSQREQEWIARLVEKHGDDTRAMARDRNINVMQQTEADIARRLRKWKGKRGVL